MTEIEIDIAAGPVRVLPVPVTTVDVLLINGPCELAGFSLRDATGDIPLEAENSVTSPAALATIVVTASLPAGTYTVNWTVELGGTLAAGDANNFQLVDVAGGLVASVNPAVAGNYPQAPVEIITTTAGTVKIIAIAAGTAGAIYSAQVSIIPTAAGNTVVELQDGNNPLAECAVPNPGADSRWYGSDGLKVRNRINLHIISGAVTGAVYARFQKNTG